MKSQPKESQQFASLPTVAALSDRHQSWEKHVTNGQLEAIALRCREELHVSLRRAGTRAVASLEDRVLTVEVEHSLTAAEHQLMRTAAGRAFFQHYIEELAEQIYPAFAHHVQQILTCRVRYTRVRVDCDRDSIVFQFGVQPSMHWELLPESERPSIYHG